ncbi:MAG TPA: hydrogenase iron-sulfur subunit [Nitrospirae bacterium]|nr:hydrogenase iron-sulfur subunit [Nitrospirota bacterium]HDZ83704.1 hydrogenase iron-sulfur subunit [Nitrospirota bacterium]
MEGNTFAAKRVENIKELLTKIGIDPERLEMFNLSAAMGPRWAEMCNEFNEKIRGLGPSPIWIAMNKPGSNI